jgi:hypothetical protein
MPFNESLAQRIRDALARKKNIEEKKMFGGIGFLLKVNLLIGVWKNSLIVRLGPEQGEEALLEPHVGDFNVTGRTMIKSLRIAWSCGAKLPAFSEAVLEITRLPLLKNH